MPEHDVSHVVLLDDLGVGRRTPAVVYIRLYGIGAAGSVKDRGIDRVHRSQYFIFFSFFAFFSFLPTAVAKSLLLATGLLLPGAATALLLSTALTPLTFVALAPLTLLAPLLAGTTLLLLAVIALLAPLRAGTTLLLLAVIALFATIALLATGAGVALLSTLVSLVADLVSIILIGAPIALAMSDQR